MLNDDGTDWWNLYYLMAIGAYIAGDTSTSSVHRWGLGTLRQAQCIAWDWVESLFIGFIIS
ncbi:MAG: hypothetical protein V7K50_14315 [Nostoc sp.]|uniref:hypothetical protein n=1 Tax=Nostoc sp. TaxID=1180 RepID=UPI002FFCC3C6